MSKELEAIKRFRDDIEIGYLPVDNVKDKQNYLCLLDTIETALRDYEITKARLDDTQTLFWENKKKVDAWDIIVNKDVDVALLKGILHANEGLHTASYYNSHFVATYRHLTQEKFDVLKEIMSKELTPLEAVDGERYLRIKKYMNK